MECLQGKMQSIDIVILSSYHIHFCAGLFLYCISRGLEGMGLSVYDLGQQ